jgi:uncharacterized membrane protein
MPESRSQRFVFIDLLRGLAVFVMIEVHVVNALLLPELRSGDFFRVLNFINGLVAPSFIFIAGFAFAIAARRKWKDYTVLSRPLLVQLRRLFIIVLIGYILHLPYFSFRKIIAEASARDWEVFFQADVLHCIGISLIILQLLVLLFKREKPVFITAGILSFIFVFGAPLVWMKDFTGILPLPIAAYFNNKHVSMFPLFPWSGYLMAGAVLSYYFVRMNEAGLISRFMSLASILGGVMIVGGIVFEGLPFTLYPVVDFWRTSPQFFFIRLGIVILLLVGLWWGEQRFHYGGSFLTRFGQESLIVYATHLMIIYGSFLGDRSIASIVGKTQGYGMSFLISAGLIVLMIGLAYLWHWLKRDHKTIARVVQWGGTILFIGLFLWREY